MQVNKASVVLYSIYSVKDETAPARGAARFVGPLNQQSFPGTDSSLPTIRERPRFIRIVTKATAHSLAH